jgi:tetratricopeptide (TPR) repeat protein
LLAAIEGDGAGATLLGQLEGTIPTLWALDDAYGGTRVLPYVSAEFQTAAYILRQGGHNSETTVRLFHLVALLAQHAGWAAFDAGQHGLAQRYYLTALRAAHQAGDRQLAAHVLADLAFQSASTDARADADDLAEVAMRAADRTPARVRASVASRAAFAYGAAGNEHAFATCRDLAHEQLDGARPEAGDPDWMYYLTPGHIDSLAASAFVYLAQTERAQGQTRRARARLRDSVQLLPSTAALRDRAHPHQRRAAVDGAWLALAHTLYGDLEQGCHVGRLTISRLDRVQSDRCVGVLRALRGALRTGRMNNPDVREFVVELERALAVQASRNQSLAADLGRG